MAKLINSLITKLTVSFIILILIVSGLTFFYTYSETKNALKDRMQDELKAVASVTATQINGDAMAALKPGDENTTAYQAINAQLNKVRDSNSDIKYIYLMREDSSGVQFVVQFARQPQRSPGARGGRLHQTGERRATADLHRLAAIRPRAAVADCVQADAGPPRHRSIRGDGRTGKLGTGA